MVNIIIGTFVMFVILSVPYSVGRLVEIYIQPKNPKSNHFVENIMVGIFVIIIGGMGLVTLYSVGKSIICNISW